MSPEFPISVEACLALPRVKANDRRCPYCQSNKWIHLEAAKTIIRRNPNTNSDEKVEMPDRYGCANCARQFLAEGTFSWKLAANIDQCAHCQSRNVLVAIKLKQGVVIACRQCNNLSLYENPGCEGQVTVEAVNEVSRLTDEALKFFGERGVEFQIKHTRLHLKNPKGIKRDCENSSDKMKREMND